VNNHFTVSAIPLAPADRPQFWSDSRRQHVLRMGTALPGPALPTASLLARVAQRFSVDIFVAEALSRKSSRSQLGTCAVTLKCGTRFPASGEVVALVGANGGGKTTTLRIVAGILRPDEGQGRVLGLDLRRGASEISERVEYRPQRVSLDADLSVVSGVCLRWLASKCCT
jgi:hypothetical protein